MTFNNISALSKSKDPVIIHPYTGYANQERIFAQARVLEDEGIKESREDSVFKNLVNAFKRFESDEISAATVEVNWGSHSKNLVTDSEGYIYLDEPHQLMLSQYETRWIPLDYRLCMGDQIVYEVSSSVMKPALDAEFGVISDIDDTILHTGVTSTLKWRVIVNSILKSSHQRSPLEGADTFYQLLQQGRYGNRQNPIFYLSNSPWNIYNYLQSFLSNNNFPKGPLLLRDIGFENEKPKTFRDGNKYKKVHHILSTYRDLPFILIGDAAEIDADIYLDIANKFPDQIRCIYIRSVDKKSKMKRLKQLIERQTHVEIVLLEDSQEGMDHARHHGFIA